MAAGTTLLDRIGMVAPPTLLALWGSPPAGADDRFCDPGLGADDPRSLVAALDAMDLGAQEPPEHLVPIAAVDERSYAVVVCSRRGGAPDAREGSVLRWHLDDVPASRQEAPLDRDAVLYAASLAEELAAREVGLRRMRETTARYHARFTEQERRPKAHDVRPMQLASQNVVVGLAAVVHDPAIDGLRVPLWQTCEVPHLGTHEANRALAAAVLCDAFHSGGTMEIRFDRGPGGAHPEGRVPAALRRFARSRGVELGTGDPAAIGPEEARALLLAVTPLTGGLRERAHVAIERGQVSAERLCVTLLVPIWGEVELDVLLACSARAASILAGGADPWDRPARMAEAEVCRAALMAGTYLRRLDRRDTAAGGGGVAVRVFEDDRRGVTWETLPEHGALRFGELPPGELPWSAGVAAPATGCLVVLPRAHPVPLDVATARELASGGDAVALLVPSDRDQGLDAALDGTGVELLRCPERLGELDLDIERRLVAARVSRS